MVPEAAVKGVLEVCAENDYTKIEKMVADFLTDAYSTSQLFEQLNELIIEDFKMSDIEKAAILEKLAVSKISMFTFTQ